MGLNSKMFDTLGMVTLVTPPSMMNPAEISFTLVDLKEEEKNQVATQLNKLYPNDNITLFIYGNSGDNGWLKQAMTKSKYILTNKDAPVWIEDIAPEAKTYYISKEQTVEQTFKNINKESEV
jgi:hypothetical protein|tara:strand:+ start:600 stop:965 length:366 start_codon:yes stop_codon:yes gene_type:complete